MNFRHCFKTLATIVFGMLISINSYSSGLLEKGINNGRGALGVSPRNALDPRRNQPLISASEAISIAERRYGGRAVGAKKIQTVNGSAYRVRILQKNGKVKNVIIDQR
jgi:uncharacterized membrane protein YkoI